MTTHIHVYSGTGNSLWAARRLAEELGDTTIVPIARAATVPRDDIPDRIGLVFPVHMWRVPNRMLAFLATLAPAPDAYIFAVAVNAGQVAGALLHLRKALAAKSVTLDAGYDLVMPSNYLPFGGPGTEDACRARIGAADETLTRIARAIAAGETGTLAKGPLWQRILFTPLGKMGARHVGDRAKGFSVDDTCTACGLCAALCPAQNITMTDGRPVWGRRCEQCLACIQWCPAEAIQLGRGSRAHRRYHHPAVTVTDMRDCAPR